MLKIEDALPHTVRVLIDATGITRKKAGVGVYGKNLIDHLVRAGQVELFLAVQDDDPDLDYSGAPGVTVLKMPSRLLRNIGLRLLFEQTVLPLLLRKHRIDVVHSLHYSFPLLRFGVKSAVTVHDMTFWSMPEVHVGIKTLFYRFFIRQARRWSDALIFVSRSAQDDFLARFGPPDGLCRVVYHGRSGVFQPRQDPEAVSAVKALYGLPERYILYVGTIEPRKNLERLVQAFARLAPAYPETSLVLAGMMGWKQEHLAGLVRDLGLEHRVLFPGFIAEQDKALVMAGCTLFAYPSLYEGFGLPVLEALASGIPTITSNVSSLPEVAGDAALLVDPEDTAGLAEAMTAILSDPALAAALRTKGPVQAASFTWEHAAEQTTAVYRAVASAS